MSETDEAAQAAAQERQQLARDTLLLVQAAGNVLERQESDIITAMYNAFRSGSLTTERLWAFMGQLAEAKSFSGKLENWMKQGFVDRNAGESNGR